ncbi:four-carbon acid sugar kinase family protein [Azospirillum sp. SYSU D00513]|uniref:four-carbon acid sugar kinase family protein n=1 Tax=Azospirillum sp. SYSU D00513 TaxID=2812561 RepID=UPI001A96F895|nr:four-carbon acid sugar kinase family protein [Azospirillum sp. SYSU D00513]
MTRLRLIADDLTGALDTAAQFARAAEPIPVHWNGLPHPLPGGSLAIDSGTRERTREEAGSIVAALAAGLARAPDALLYAKLDSLLRGHAGAEIAAWIGAVAPSHCIIAPAFPYQGRVTRGGVQQVRGAEGWRPAETDLRADLLREGLEVRLCRPGDPVPPGISLWDAESDADLAAISTAGRALGAPVLWCGSGGLAGALAGPPAVPSAGPGHAPLPRPVLGLFGTDHPVMAEQLSACGTTVLDLPDGGEGSAALLSGHLAWEGAALARLTLPEGLDRADAARRIERGFGDLVRRLAPPGTLVVAGGETLRGLCLALGAERLDLDGHILPGVPCSILRGGRFAGVRVISKSGAFGDPGLLRRLLAATVNPEGDNP